MKPNGPIDLASVNWLYVAILAVFVFVASLIGNFLSFGRRASGALLSAILFAAAFVAWSYYPHHLPLPIVAQPAGAAGCRSAATAARARGAGAAGQSGAGHYAAEAAVGLHPPPRMMFSPFERGAARRRRGGFRTQGGSA